MEDIDQLPLSLPPPPPPTTQNLWRRGNYSALKIAAALDFVSLQQCSKTYRKKTSPRQAEEEDKQLVSRLFFLKTKPK